MPVQPEDHTISEQSSLLWDIGNERRESRKADKAQAKDAAKTLRSEAAKTLKRDDRKAGKVEAKKVAREANDKRRVDNVEAKRVSQETNDKRRVDNVDAKSAARDLRSEAAKTLKRDDRKAGKVEAKKSAREVNDKRRAGKVEAKKANQETNEIARTSKVNAKASIRAHRKAEARIHNIVVDHEDLTTVACWEDFHCEDYPDGLIGKCVLPANPEEVGVCHFADDDLCNFGFLDFCGEATAAETTEASATAAPTEGSPPSYHNYGNGYWEDSIEWDRSTHTTTETTLEQCQAICDQNSGCIAFTLYSMGLDGNVDPLSSGHYNDCYIYDFISGINGWTSTEYAVSFTKVLEEHGEH